MSLKDQGNDYFRKLNYQKAIECYNKYVETDHDDNKNAYFNLSLCHSNINMFNEAIVDCTKAIEEDPEYAKPYYKRCKLYRTMEDHEYEIFIDAAVCYKLTDEKEENLRDQLMVIMKEQKQKLKYKVHKNTRFQQYQKILKIFEEINYSDKHTSNDQPKTKQWEDWIQQWKHSKNKDVDWNQIRDVAMNADYNYGINLAYFYLNQHQDELSRKQIQQKIKNLKEQKAANKAQNVQEQSIIQSMQEEKKEENQSDQQNLFESKSESQSQPIQPAPIKIQSSPIQVTKPEQINRTNPTVKIQRNQDRECSEQQIDSRYQYYFGKLKNSRDTGKDVIEGIIQILQSQQIRSMKMSLLSRLKKKQSDINILTKSCNNKQRTLIQNLITQNQIALNFAFKQPRK